MAGIKHQFTSAKSDGGDTSLVRPTDWNAEHLVGTAGVKFEANTSFPGSPSADDLCYRTDTNLLYFYDGTRWLTEELFDGRAVGTPTSAAGSQISATTNYYVTLTVPSEATIYIERFRSVFYCVSGLSGSAYWTARLVKVTAAESSTNLGSGVSIVSGTNANYLVRTEDLNTTVDLSSTPVTYITVTKVSTPGNLFYMGGFTYRLVG